MPDEREAAVAYPGRQSTFARLLAALVLAALGIMLLSNVFFRDYKVETENYLRKADPKYAERVLGKPPVAAMDQQKQTQMLTDVINDVQKLKEDVAAIQQTLANWQPTKEDGDEKAQ